VEVIMTKLIEGFG